MWHISSVLSSSVPVLSIESQSNLCIKTFAELPLISFSSHSLKENAKQDSEKLKSLSLDLQRRDDDSSDLREKLADYKKQIQQVQKEVLALHSSVFLFKARSSPFFPSVHNKKSVGSHAEDSVIPSSFKISAMREEEKVLRQKVADVEKARKQLQSEVANRDRSIQQLKAVIWFFHRNKPLEAVAQFAGFVARR